MRALIEGVVRAVRGLRRLGGAGRRPDRERAGLTSDIPTLLLSGAYDPVTPPSWGTRRPPTSLQHPRRLPRHGPRHRRHPPLPHPDRPRVPEGPVDEARHLLRRPPGATQVLGAVGGRERRWAADPRTSRRGAACCRACSPARRGGLRTGDSAFRPWRERCALLTRTVVHARLPRPSCRSRVARRTRRCRHAPLDGRPGADRHRRRGHVRRATRALRHALPARIAHEAHRRGGRHDPRRRARGAPGRPGGTVVAGTRRSAGASIRRRAPVRHRARSPLGHTTGPSHMQGGVRHRAPHGRGLPHPGGDGRSGHRTGRMAARPSRR
jgi:hypothetical protein